MTVSVRSTGLFGTDRDLATAMESSGVALAATRALGVGLAVGMPIASELGRACSELMYIDIATLLLRGWRTHRDVYAAAERTAQVPGTIERLGLARHEITSEHKPTVELSVNGAAALSIDVELRIVLSVLLAELTVTRGSVVAVEVGDVEISGTLAANGVPLLAPSPRRIELGRHLDIGAEWPLAPPRPAPWT